MSIPACGMRWIRTSMSFRSTSRQTARTLLSERGYDPVLGARPLRRTIQREIEDHLSEKILFGELKAGQIVMVDTEGTGTDGKFVFTGVPKPDAVPDAPVPLQN